MLSEQQKCVLVVVESCSSWPAWSADPALAPVVIEQQDGEASAELVDRLLGQLGTTGASPKHAVIVCNERIDQEACSARARLISALLARAGMEAIVLATSDRSSGCARRALAELASDCNARFDTTCVSVRFGPGLSIPPSEAA